jgi:hypothetical protein
MLLEQGVNPPQAANENSVQAPEPIPVESESAPQSAEPTIAN